MLQLIWPDGSIAEAASWTGLERAARESSPWSARTRSGWRRQMRRRAEVWAGPLARIPRFASSERFMRALEDVSLFRVEEVPACPRCGRAANHGRVS